MESQTIEQFKQTLLDRKYQIPGKAGRRILEDACLEAIKKSGGAVWYGDFIDPLTQVVTQLFDSDKIFLNSWLKSSYHFSIRPEESTSEQKLEQQKKIEYALKERSYNALVAFNMAKTKRRKFKINDLYGVLREHYELGKLDRVNVQLPAFASQVSDDQKFETLFNIYREINEKRFSIQKYVNEGRNCPSDEEVQRWYEHKKHYGKKYIIKSMSQTIKRALLRARVAYTNTKSALDILDSIPLHASNIRTYRMVTISPKID